MSMTWPFQHSNISTNTQLIWPNHIQGEHLAALAMLITMPLMGIERYEKTKHLPPERQCRISPRIDRDMQRFSILQKLVPWVAERFVDSL